LSPTPYFYWSHRTPALFNISSTDELAFGSALNLNIHFHMLYLDGVYAGDNSGKTSFHPIKAPTKSELNSLTHSISQRVAGFLEREGLLVRDDDNDYLALDGLEDDPMLQIQGYSITYRIATGKQQGRKRITRTNYKDSHRKKTKRITRTAIVRRLDNRLCRYPLWWLRHCFSAFKVTAQKGLF
jgi:hypothetical protein